MNSEPEVCVVCASRTLHQHKKFGSYALFECGACKLQFWWPFKNPGRDFYERVEALAARNRDPEAHPLFPSQRRFLAALPKRGGTLLDLGMGTGKFLAEAQKLGYIVTGCDFDRDAVAAAKTIYNLEDVHVLSIEEYAEQNPGKQFDIITMFEVIEHLDDFRIFTTVRALLTPGGLLVLSTPNRRRWAPFMRGDDPPRHLTRWDRDSLKNFLERQNFSVMEIRLMPIVFNRLLMRFNEWTAGWLSFSLSKKLDRPALQTAARAEGGEVRARSRFIRALSRIKLYVFFFMPASLLYAYLFLTGRRNCTALYAVAKRV